MAVHGEELVEVDAQAPYRAYGPETVIFPSWRLGSVFARSHL